MKDFRHLAPVDYLAILWRRKWYALAGFFLVGAVAGVVAWQIKSVYRAEARIIADSGPISDDYVRQSDRISAEDRIAGVRLQIQARSFLEQLIQDFQMYGNSNGKDSSMDEAVEGLKRNIQVSSPGGGAIALTFFASDPQAARDVAKALADRIVAAGVSQRRNKAIQTNQFVEDQLKDVEKSLAELEVRIKNFKLSHLGELPEQGNANMSALTGLYAQLAAVENALERNQDQKQVLDLRIQERKRLRAFLEERKKEPGATEASVKAPLPVSVAENPQLQARKAQLAELMTRYTPSHPDIVRLTDEIEEMEKQLTAMAARQTQKETLTPLGPEPAKKTEIKTDAADLSLEAEAARDKLDMENLDRDLAKRQKEREEIQKQINIYQGRLSMAPALEQELQSLARERETLQVQYSNLQAKKFQSQMTENLETNRKYESYRILDEPVLPTSPVFPNRLQLILMGLAASLIAGVASAFGREYMDPTLGTEEEAIRALNLPILVSIPELSNAGVGKRNSLPGRAA